VPPWAGPFISAGEAGWYGLVDPLHRWQIRDASRLGRQARRPPDGRPLVIADDPEGTDNNLLRADHPGVDPYLEEDDLGCVSRTSADGRPDLILGFLERP